MGQNFFDCRRGQGFLLPPDVREWLPADHLAWFVVDAVAGMNLGAFYAAYRADGHGRATYEPSLMVAQILYAFATGVRSSRVIECHCRQDVAYCVITGNVVPDRATIARFICRHERALAELFAEVLKLCDRAGLVKPRVVSIDGTRIAGNASPEVNHECEQLAREILAETRAADAGEDEAFGEARGYELPAQLRSAEGRREFFRQARGQMRSEQESSEPAGEPEADGTHEVMLELSASVAFVIDAFSRRIVGWKADTTMKASLVLDTLEMALWSRQRQGVPLAEAMICHNDAGSQYTSFAFTSRLLEAGIDPSVGSVGDGYDNALAETTIGLFKTEKIHREGPWRSLAQVELATLEWVDWYNHARLHSACGESPPRSTRPTTSTI